MILNEPQNPTYYGLTITFNKEQPVTILGAA